MEKIAEKKPSKKQEKIIKEFKNKFQGLMASRSFENYNFRLKQLLSKNIKITSKAKYKQFKAVLSKLKEIGIELKIKLPKYTKKGNTSERNIIEKYISPEQLTEILQQVPNTPKGGELARAIKISYYSGLRLAEVLKLKKSDIVMTDRIRINVFQGKGNKYRAAYLPKDKKDLIDGFIKFSLSEAYVKTTIARISEKINFKFSFHSFRHSYASNTLKAGGNIYFLQRRLGHSNITTTSIYLHCIDETEELEKLGF